MQLSVIFSSLSEFSITVESNMAEVDAHGCASRLECLLRLEGSLESSLLDSGCSLRE